MVGQPGNRALHSAQIGFQLFVFPFLMIPHIGGDACDMCPKVMAQAAHIAVDILQVLDLLIYIRHTIFQEQTLSLLVLETDNSPEQDHGGHDHAQQEQAHHGESTKVSGTRS